MLAILMTPLWGVARDVGGVRMPERLEFGETSLVLNGAGVRSKYFVEVYVAALYLKQKMRDPARIVDADEAMAVRLQIVSSLITPERMEEALIDAFKNATGGDLESIQPQVDRFIDVFRNDIGPGDVYDVFYLPGTGVQVYKNGELRDTAAGMAFKRACFGAWLGEKPAQKSLKRAMLGG